MAEDAAPAMLPGTLIAGRYRLVALVGRGGMGEVYRADDIRLGQPVALKFLPAAVTHEEPRLTQLLDEVRIARQVSHPNVCRVYDVGEADGRYFLTMEFIDGEDLASLLRRIGRVPPEKAVELARQMCAGLAAAHDQRVLHRDLKPANVMIDGRGRARITDFGLAALEERIPLGDIRSGTPAYMAPEQLEGREVTVRSDIYALGLVLYEVFAGRRAFERAGTMQELRERSVLQPSSPSTHVAGLDPAIERTILRCLEPDPAARPSSALAVAAGLPGGDPLAAALAAGETPAPDVVAAASKKGSLRPGVAAGVLAATLVTWAAAFVLTTWPLRYVSFERSPDALADRARDLLATLGHRAKPVDRAWGYLRDDDLLIRLDHDPAPGLVDAALSGRAPVVRFWYRESAEHLVPRTAERVDRTDPRFETVGARAVEMTTDGRLVSLRVIASVDPTRAAAPDVDWKPLLAAAGFDSVDLEPTPPTTTPPDFADHRVAWQTRATEPAGVRMRLEGAALQGLPVYFQSAPDVLIAAPTPPAAATARMRFFFVLLGTLFTFVLLAAVWLARRNHIRGRADRGGAARIAMVVLGVEFVTWILIASHAPSLGEFWLFFRFLAWALLEAGIVWLLYVALEPVLRRRSPSSLVSWARLLDGRASDPLVGRDLLLGSLFGAVFVCSEAVTAIWLRHTGEAPVAAPSGVENLIGVPALFLVSGSALVSAFVQAMGYLVLWQLFSWGLRSSLRGAIALYAMMFFGLTVAGGVGVESLITVPVVALLVFAFTRLGLLASVTMMWILHMTFGFPLWSEPSAWFAGVSAVIFVLGALPAVWGAWATARGSGAAAASL